MDISKWLSKNASSILSMTACVGVALTAVLTYKGTIKAQETIKEWTEEKRDELTTFEKVQASAKPLAGAAVAAVGTIACIIGSHKIDKKHIAVLGAGAAGIAKKYDEYRKANIEVNGKEADDKVMQKLAVEKAEHSNICAESMFEMTSLNSKLSKEEFLFYDDITETYFTSTLAQVYDAINALNRNFTMGYSEVDVDMWCNFLGIKNKKHDTRGWVLCDDFTWIDFNISDPVDLGDGMEALVISTTTSPIPDYLNYDPLEDKYYDDDGVSYDPEDWVNSEKYAV